MSFYSTVAYAKYIVQAKGRHGIHSPFVYDFIEKVLHDREVIPRNRVIEIRDIKLRFENIISRAAAHYDLDNIVIPSQQEDLTSKPIDLLLLKKNEYKIWSELFEKYASQIKPTGIVIVTGIHHSADHNSAWKKLCADARTKASIDLYGIGILLFFDEFKEKQQFVLKY